MSNYRGDYALGSTAYFKFTTVDSSGVAATLASTSLLEAYVNGSTTPSTLGLTISTDFNGRTGLNHVRAVLASTNNFASGDDVSICIQTGLVGSKSLVGYVAGSLSIEGRSALRPVTAGRTLAVNASNQASADVIAISGDSTAADNLETVLDDTAGAVPWIGIIDQGTAQSASGNDIVIRSAAAFPNDNLIGKTIAVFGSTQGYWQSALITANVLSTDTVTISPPTGWVTPSGTITYKIFGSAPGATTAEIGTAVWATGTRVLTAATNLTTALATPTNITAGTITTVTNLTNAPTSGDLTATMKTSVTTAATAATPTISTLGANTITAASLAADAGAEIADAVWDEATSGHSTAGTTGKALTDASSAGDPWSTALPGAYSAGTAGKIMGDNLNATITSRASQTSVDTVDTVVDAIKVKTDSLTFTVAGNVDANIQTVNETNIDGTGTEGDPWGPA